MILCANPKAQYVAHQAEIDVAIQRALEKGHYIRGEECQAFEKEFSAWLGLEHTIGVANGTDALRIAMTALGIGYGDEVLTPSHTAVATVSAIELAGATPVFVDTDEFFTMCPEDLAKKVTPKCKAVIAVHLFGNVCNLPAIQAICRKSGLKLIEDCAQAHGARLDGRMVGTWGDIAAFSFYPTKNLGALGDGGGISTNDAALADRCRLLSEYGWRERFISEIAGGNSRLDEIQAAVLRVKLKYLDRDNESRRRIAALYGETLEGTGLTLPRPRPGAEHVYHLYVTRTADRDQIRDRLKGYHVYAGVHYPMPIHQQPAYRNRFPTTLPRTEKHAGDILSLPMYPELMRLDQDIVIRAVREVTRSGGRAAA